MSDDTNPKDAAGRAKLPLHLWPASATAYGAIGLYEGMLKYGRLNWRGTQVSASVYVAALMRHLAAWMEGEEHSAEGAPHLGNALACLAILVDAQVQGTLVDDRNYVANPEGHGLMIAELQQSMRKLEAKFGQVNPKHWDRTVESAESNAIFDAMFNTIAQTNPKPQTEAAAGEPQCNCLRCTLERVLQASAPPGVEVKLMTDAEVREMMEAKDKPKH